MRRQFLPVLTALALLVACNAPQEESTAPSADASARSASESSTSQSADPDLVEEGALEGRFFLSGSIDEGALRRDSTHFYVWLEGESAAALYRHLPGEATEHACEDGHKWSKTQDAIICTANADSTEHRCYFAVDIPEAQLRTGVSC